MSSDRRDTAPTRILVKLRPTASLGAAESRANLRPLYEGVRATQFGAASEAEWYIADLADGAAQPWDLAHARVADQLGIAGSDVLFVEPDLIHTIYTDRNETDGPIPFGVTADCAKQVEQDAGNKKAVGAGFAWHLGDDFSQLGSARNAVEFSAPHTRIAHLDTGYFSRHATTPANVLKTLERNFVDRDGMPGSAEDPDNKVFLLDNSGHGTGTLGILAGKAVQSYGPDPIGGAPLADIVPLRIADQVVLLRTSSFARALGYAVEIGCDVVTMSMGGLPMRSWREAVDRAYLAGICVVCAAGNNVANLPTRHLVYPARYGRVIAACGVMADGKPYHDLAIREMQGNFGPGSVMQSALSAYTPNIPWAVFGCDTMLRLNGAGTSSATPQIAAAAALWYERYKSDLPRDWRRVEAVRNALFESARAPGNHRAKLGRGILRAMEALRIRPRFDLPQTKSDNDSFAFFRVLTGLGIAEPTPREQMLNLELTQRWLLNPELQRIVKDPEKTTSLTRKQLRDFMEAVIEDGDASQALRAHLAARYPSIEGRTPTRTEKNSEIIPDALQACDGEFEPSTPAHRRLRVYAVDPSFSGRLATATHNEVTLNVRWEPLPAAGSDAHDATSAAPSTGADKSSKPSSNDGSAKGTPANPAPAPDPLGLVGEYLAFDNTDAKGVAYRSISLDDPRLLAQDGWAPSEGNPQFHQQMVYAVVMNTIAHFERALGRPVLWRPRPTPKRPADDSRFVRQLTVAPHAIRQANAFYSPAEVALKFGYFEALGDGSGGQLPGSRVYTCLSHDIVVHEATHAILDGMFRRFNEPSNLDVLALHEAFADIVALMQHFTISEILVPEISRTRGNLEAESMLGSLAVQFGRASGGHGALRDAIGRLEGGVWKRLAPDPTELQRRVTPHARGAILVAAVFDAFIAIYNTRVADLLRIYTGGTGVLPTGSIHPDLVGRLAEEATKSARHVLDMCIRAVDYLPPVDVTFFEYLRAIITADFDLVSHDRLNYRLAFVEAFRNRGIYPLDMGDPDSAPPSLSVDTLRWKGINLSKFSSADPAVFDLYRNVVDSLKSYADSCFYISDREQLFHATRAQRGELHGQLQRAFAALPEFAREIRVSVDHPFEVHELRRAMRINSDGKHVPQIIVSITQERSIAADSPAGTPRFEFRGGSTLVFDLSESRIKYAIYKRVDGDDRLRRTANFMREVASDPLRALFFATDRTEPFAALHALAEDGL